MFKKWNTNQWHWSMGFNPAVDFAIWVLEQDGLQVAPFTDYPNSLGNGKLSALGFTADDWQVWFYRLIQVNQEEQKRLSSSSDSLPTIIQPNHIYTGAAHIQEALGNLWKLYLPISNSRRYFETLLDQQISPTPRVVRDLWNTINSARGTLPPLQIILNGYPAYVEYAIPPATIILAPGGIMLHTKDWETILLRGIRELQNASA